MIERSMLSGLEVLLSDPSRLRGQRVGLCCNHTAITRELDHALPLLRAAGVDVVRLFGPEHGLEATAQDMVAVGNGEPDGGPARPSVVSLYGPTVQSLRPLPEQLDDLDCLLFDIQDIGSRYYTFQATLQYILEVCAGMPRAPRVIVLDRPNPIDGVTLEGNVVQPGFESFVSASPLAIRHGMTMGELGTFFVRQLGIKAELEVIPCQGWERDQWLDETDQPWVFPSPNMPTLETAAIYPGMCLIEGTNLSEGRGTTRPFHLVGAPWLDRERFARYCRQGAVDSELSGVAFRAATFEPRFQKHGGQPCHGVEIFVTDRRAMEPFLLGLVVLEAAIHTAPEHFRWRTETYEFVDDPIAIDLLCGSHEARVGLESRIRPRDLLNRWKTELDTWAELREECLLY